MDRRTLLAMTLCFLIFMGWQKYYIEPRLPKAQTAQVVQTQQAVSGIAPVSGTTENTQPGSNSASSSLSATTPATSTVAPHSEVFTAQTGDAVLTNGKYAFSNWSLSSYHQGISKDSPLVDLAWVTQQEGEVTLAFDDPEYAYLDAARGTLTSYSGRRGAVWNYDDAKIKIVREVSEGENAQTFLKFNVQFKQKAPKYAFVSTTSQSYKDDPQAQDRNLVYFTNESIERVRLKDSLSLTEVPTPVHYIGATNRYFVFALINQSPVEPKGLIQPTQAYGGRASLVYPISGNTLNLDFKTYFGPKDLAQLRAVDPKLDHTVDFGWFVLIAYPLLKILKFFYSLIQNYGIAIILLTLFIKVLTYPLTYKSMKSMREMAKLQPQLARIKEKYKDDKEALNREMMTLMRGHGYNPVAGCLPMLIQMPVFFALYRVLYSSIELYHAPFGLWIFDLSAKDPFYVFPVLLTITMFLQQKITPSAAADPAQQKMMQYMPLIFGGFMLPLPSGLTIYMLTNAVASIFQQMILNKKLGPLPTPVRAVPAKS